MKKNILVLIIIFILLNLTGCNFKLKKDIQLLENRIHKLTNILGLHLIYFDLDDWGISYYEETEVDLEDLKTLEQQLGDLAKKFKIPEKVDFSKLKKSKNKEVHGDRYGRWPEKSTKKHIDLAFKSPLMYFKKENGKFSRVEWTKGDIPLQDLPECGEEFTIYIIDEWDSTKDKKSSFKSKFYELRLRAVKEASLFCSRNYEKCPKARPTKIWSIHWSITGNINKLSISFGFECWGI